MTTHVSGWMALFAWLSVMLIVGALFVPRGLSVGTFTLFTLTGPLVLVAGSVLWGVYRPSPSVRQKRPPAPATTDARPSG